MSELRGKNLLMEDLFHAHWSKNHRQKKYWSRAHLQTEKTTFEKRAATTKDPHPSSKTNRLAQLFGPKSERTHTKTRLSLCTFVVFLLESLCQVLLDIFALAFLLLNGIFSLQWAILSSPLSVKLKCYRYLIRCWCDDPILEENISLIW